MTTRVVYVLDTNAMGGAEFHLLTLVRHLDRQQFEPNVILSPGAGDLPLGRMLEEAGVPVEFHAMPRDKWDVGILRDLIRVLRRSSPEIVHIHLPSPVSNWYAFIAARGAACPFLVSTEHVASEPWMFPNLRARLIKRFLVALQDSIIVPSDHVRERLVKNVHVSPRKFVTINHGIEIPNAVYKNSGAGVRLELGIDLHTPLVGMVARIDPVKRFGDFLAAAQRIAREIPTTHFLIVGDGNPHHRLALQRLAEQLGVEKRVHFLGFRDDALQIISDLDVLVLASDSESWGLVTLEAMARETPVVATDLGGTREQVVNGETGYLVPPRDITAIAEAVLALLRNLSQARVLAKQARRVAECRFGARRMAEETEALYLRLLAPKRLTTRQGREPVAGRI